LSMVEAMERPAEQQAPQQVAHPAKPQ
jgi:hypothetical protein